jgi:nitrite reductase/ring-hydroxylating ferredoxin subunit
VITDGYAPVARRSEIADGDMVAVDALDGEPVCLVNLGGSIYAVHDNCPHQDFPLSAGEVHDGTIECPLHGARFDVRTGAVCRGPAIDDAATYAVRVEGDTILLGKRR